MPMLAAWNRSTLAQFADRLSAAVEQGLDGMDPMPQPFTAGASSSSPEATASGGSSADAPAAQCSHCPVPQEQIRPTSYAEEAERTAGTRAGGTEVCEVLLEGAAAAAQQGHAAQTSGIEYQQHGLVLDKMSPPTPAGRDTRASMIVASPVVRDAVGAPDGSLDEDVHRTPQPLLTSEARLLLVLRGTPRQGSKPWTAFTHGQAHRCQATRPCPSCSRPLPTQQRPIWG